MCVARRAIGACFAQKCREQSVARQSGGHLGLTHDPAVQRAKRADSADRGDSGAGIGARIYIYKVRKWRSRYAGDGNRKHQDHGGADEDINDASAGGSEKCRAVDCAFGVLHLVGGHGRQLKPKHRP